MDLSTAPQAQPETNYQVTPVSGAAAPKAGNGRYPTPTQGVSPMPVKPASPLQHALVMGGATTLSVAISCCCLLSVAGHLGPGRRLLNTSWILGSIAAGIYVGFRAWTNSRAPRPIAAGRCPDCGRELILGQQSCSLCGRVVQL